MRRFSVLAAAVLGFGDASCVSKTRVCFVRVTTDNVRSVWRAYGVSVLLKIIRHCEEPLMKLGARVVRVT